MYRDYEVRPELDEYEAEHMDDEDQSELSYAGRAEAEKEMRRRDRAEADDRGDGERYRLLYGDAESEAGSGKICIILNSAT